MPQMINPIHTIECLVDDYGWDAVMDELMVMAATAPEVDLDEVQELLDAAIAVNEGEGSYLIAEAGAITPHMVTGWFWLSMSSADQTSPSAFSWVVSRIS